MIKYKSLHCKQWVHFWVASSNLASLVDECSKNAQKILTFICEKDKLHIYIYIINMSQI